MTSRTRSYLPNQRSWRLKIVSISGEKLEMQLYKNSALYLKRCGVQLRKKHLGVAPHRCGRGLTSFSVVVSPVPLC